MTNAQQWLDKLYPKEGGCLRKNEGYKLNNLNKKRSEIEKLHISNEHLESSLDLSDFSSLKELYCFNNQLTNLNLSNCRKLTLLECAGNPFLTNLDLDNCSKLGSSYEGSLTCNKNQLKAELDLSKFPKLKNYNIHYTTSAQIWLDENYPVNGVCLRKKDFWENPYLNNGKTRQQITKLDIFQQHLEGPLSLTGFDNLKKLKCGNNYLTELTINSSRLKETNQWNEEEIGMPFALIVLLN